MWRAYFSLLLLPLALTIACNSDRHSAAGFRLPSSGDMERGKAVFLELKCHTCHQVNGVNLPHSPSTAEVRVMLGGETLRDMTDGYLVTSIINPSARIAPHRDDLRKPDGTSRMPIYADNLTVRQLTDLVAFLQSHYTLRAPTNELHQF